MQGTEKLRQECAQFWAGVVAALPTVPVAQAVPLVDMVTEAGLPLPRITDGTYDTTSTDDILSVLLVLPESTLEALASTASIPKPAYRIERVLGYDSKARCFTVPTTVHEADYGELVKLVRSPYDRDPMPMGAEYAPTIGPWGITVPVKWHYWSVLQELTNTFGYSATKGTASVFQQFMSLLGGKSATVGTEGNLMLECIPDFRLHDNIRLDGEGTPVWDSRKLARTVVRANSATKHSGTTGMYVENPDKKFTGFDLPYWEYPILKELEEDWGFTMDGVHSNPIVAAKKMRYLRNEYRMELARSGMPITDDDRYQEYSKPLQSGVELFPHQIAGIQFIDWVLNDEYEGNRGVMVADWVGLGKTLMALGYCQFSNLRPFAVVPANLVSNWVQELRIAYGTQLKVLRTKAHNQEEREGLQLLASLPPEVLATVAKDFILVVNSRETDVVVERLAPYVQAVIVSHSCLATWSEELQKIIPQLGPFVYIWDEAHKMKGRTRSKIGQAYLDLARPIHSEQENVVLSMTATFHVKEVMDYYPHVHMCFPQDRYLVEESDRGTPGTRFRKYFKSYPAGIYQQYGSRTLYRTHNTVPEMPTVTWETGKVVLPPEIQEQYNTLVDRLVESLQKRFPLGIPTLAMYTYLRHIAARLKAKVAVPALKQHIESVGGKHIIFAHHKSVIAQVKRTFGCPAITGGMTEGDRDAVKSWFNDPALENAVLVASTTISAGWNALGTDVWVIEPDWSWSNIFQAAGRAVRINNPHKSITARLSILQGTFEEVLLTHIMRKKEEGWAVANGFDIDEDAGSFMSDILQEVFPGVKFTGSMKGTTTDGEVDALIDSVLPPDDTTSTEEYVFRASGVGHAAIAAMDAGIGHIVDAVDSSGTDVLLFICHGGSDGSIDRVNQELIADLADPLVVCCHPAQVAARYGYNTVGDWDCVSLLTVKGTTVTVTPERN